MAQGTHQYMIDNPRGFEDAILSAIRGAASHVAVLVTAPIGAGFGRHYGAHAQIFKRVTGVKPCARKRRGLHTLQYTDEIWACSTRST